SRTSCQHRQGTPPSSHCHRHRHQDGRSSRRACHLSCPHARHDASSWRPAFLPASRHHHHLHPFSQNIFRRTSYGVRPCHHPCHLRQNASQRCPSSHLSSPCHHHRHRALRSARPDQAAHRDALGTPRASFHARLSFPPGSEHHRHRRPSCRSALQNPHGILPAKW